ncbi:hypothetical protein PYW07_013869 [Mythimna separata]|uniref:C3H1-type domain-containing protein n=1 Tax=Mythimna separata TaxID=271217 RepID=A0AAD7YFY6_MYTSE|nr:hypothetical protein PYW07_013869 [Mythimna separata]
MDWVENSKSKVYINPNFNRPPTSNFPSSATMYVNPKFSQFVSHGQSNIQNKNKIFINPNFMKSRSISHSNPCVSTSVNNHVIPDIQNPVSNSLTSYQQSIVYKEATALPAPVAQSRYSLVRQNVNNKPLNETTNKPISETPKTTFKLNKYKTVSWKDIKRTVNSVKNVKRFETNFQIKIHEKASYSLVLNRKSNEFKLSNCYNATPLKNDKIKTKIFSETHKKLYKSNQATPTRMKKIKGNLKKNNIPCPLFRKFGKCLRNSKGRCEFLHDRKHVSICRKFIKGLCHDKECLLSHDLTTKKMPTCYFYLQGTCTKAECPYLHVKLSEKTKICPDFLKGYCEKGSKCLQRHVNIAKERKIPTSQIRNSFRKKYNEPKICKGDIKNHEQPAEEHDAEVLPNAEKTSVSTENRYYDEHKDTSSPNESYETIKPMRCKLGTLPSFIQL